MKVHPLTNDPTLAWEDISKTQKFYRKRPETPHLPPKPNTVRFVCTSDTHAQTDRIDFKIPDGDVLLFAGDFCIHGGLRAEVTKFNDWLGTLPHKYKVVICGNHELIFDETYCNGSPNKGYLKNCIYLEDQAIELFGVKIYGSPWGCSYRDGAFTLSRGEESLKKWNEIPDDTDILLTHAPPIGHGDLTTDGKRVGCVELLQTIQQRVRPKYHVFGHIHEDYGITSDGRTTFINASMCDIKYNPVNVPIVFDMRVANDTSTLSKPRRRSKCCLC